MSVTLFVLLLGLALSAYNLSLMTVQTGSLYGISQSWNELAENFRMRTLPAVETPPAPVASVPVLWSVVKFGTGEESMLREKLAAPLADYYVEAGPKLQAALIEKKNPVSKAVNVRLFFADGSETSYLWPTTHSKAGRWMPPCVTAAEDVRLDVPGCPTSFMAKYPDIVAELRK